MLELVQSLVWEALVCPFTTATILISCWIWIKFYVEEWDSRNFSYNYNDVLIKNQWWRILVAPVSHSALYHLLLNSTAIWGCRLVELNLGTFFVFRYSIVLAISEGLLSVLLIHYTIKWAPMGPLIEPILTNNSSFGCSGVIIAWLSFQMFAITDFVIKKHFVLFGLVTLSHEFALIVLISIYYVVLPKQTILSNSTGLASGLFLYIGVLQIVPDLYWSLCFLLDVSLIMLASVVLNQNAVLPRSARDEGGELVEVQSYGSGESSAPSAVSTAGETGDDRQEEDLEMGTLHSSSSSDNLLSTSSGHTLQFNSGSQRNSLSNRLTNSVDDSSA